MATTRRKSRKPARRVKRAKPKARSSSCNPRVRRKANGQFARKARANRTRKPARKARRASRSNPGFAAGTPVWARINGRLYKAIVLSTSGARARVAVIDPYSGRESIRETAVSHLQARPASRSNPRGDDREVTIYEVIYDGSGVGSAGDGTHIARFKSASDAARFAANHTAWGRPTKADAAKVPVRLTRRWGVM